MFVHGSGRDLEKLQTGEEVGGVGGWLRVGRSSKHVVFQADALFEVGLEALH